MGAVGGDYFDFLELGQERLALIVGDIAGKGMAAALLMARHRELVGRPGEVKRVLCDSATDLGRERHYQGHGMLDILRAIQSV